MKFRSPRFKSLIDIVFCLPILLTGCFHPSEHIPLQLRGESQISSKRVAHGTDYAVSSSHPLATEAAKTVLSAGGNAADAVVAASYVMSVVQPHATGIGGGGFLLYFNNSEQKVDAYDFRERAPQAAHSEMYRSLVESASREGVLAAGVPGLVKGLSLLHDQHGSMEYASLLAPAIQFAEEGFLVSSYLAEAFAIKRAQLERFPTSKRVFFPEGKLLEEGDRLVQKDLGTTLRSIAGDKGRDFYHGSFAKKLGELMQASSGVMTAQDLAGYKVLRRSPLEKQMMGRSFYTMPLPSSGIAVLQGLRMYEMLRGQEGRDETQRLPLHASVLEQVFRDRACFYGDDRFEPVSKLDVKQLLSDDYIEQKAKRVKDGLDAPSCPEALEYESDSTVHISVIDRYGNAASSTQTINMWFGSGVVVPETGVLLNNEMDDFVPVPGKPNGYGLVGGSANWVQPGKTMLSSMSPVLVTKDEAVEVAVGAPGGPRIVSAVYQTLANYFVDKFPPEQSVNLPRVHHQWKPEQVWVEEDVSESSREALSAVHGKVVESSRGLARVELIAPCAASTADLQENGRRCLTAVSDKRSEGSAAAE